MADVACLHPLDHVAQGAGWTRGHHRLRHEVSDQELRHDRYFTHLPCQPWSGQPMAHIMRLRKSLPHCLRQCWAVETQNMRQLGANPTGAHFATDQHTMPDTFHERLSALDATFLDVESKEAPMHVGAALIFDAKPLMLEHGGLDIERLTRYTEAALDSIPRYRQRVEWTPGFGHPVWVDDGRFNMHFHLRHTRLPLPGDERSLKRLVGRLFSQHLDRSRPLWEFWVVEGVERERFALIIKVHHCMVDGVAGVELLEALLQVSPDAMERKPKEWRPRPAPSRAQLVLN
ncbi:MAG: hypothetical protein E4H00_03335, partial [Myxococcales bacterium]